MSRVEPTTPFAHKVRARHRDRLAVVCVRQSTAHQVVSNRESTDLQYQLRQRAVTLGLADARVLVIDDDQGISGSSVENRPGFQRLLAEVSLGHVGVIFGREVSRLSRSCRDRERLHTHWRQRLERAGYEADRARRQYDAAEPENRLVTRALERQWEQKFAEQQRLAEDHARFQAEQPRHLSASDRERIGALAADLPGLWRSPTTTGGDRRAIVPLLIGRVELTRHGETERVDVAIHWRGGLVTRHEIRQGLRTYRSLSGLARLRQRTRELSGDGQTGEAIAEVLNREGYRVARGEPR